MLTMPASVRACSGNGANCSTGTGCCNSHRRIAPAKASVRPANARKAGVVLFLVNPSCPESPMAAMTGSVTYPISVKMCRSCSISSTVRCLPMVAILARDRSICLVNP